MRFSSFVAAAMVLLSLGGCYINYRLTELHVTKNSAAGLFMDLCSPEQYPALDCKAVIKTKWAMWPPNEPDPVTGQQMGVPVSLLGWAYFTCVGLWALVIGRCDHARRGWHVLYLFGIVCGCAVSVFYTYILFFTPMEAKCVWCIASHGINFLLLIGALLLFPRGQATADAVQRDGEMSVGPESVQPAAHPSNRLILATVVAALALVYAESGILRSAVASFEARQQRALAQQYRQTVEEFYQDSEALLSRYDREKPVEIKPRPDDPHRGKGTLLLPLVVFSDFQCPACGDFARKTETRLMPAFDNLLHVYWKHMPWGKECNPHAARDLHPQACDAAFASEAARILGGNDAFWKFHDRIFADQRVLADMDYRKLAVELGLDPEAFVSTMQSEQVKQRVQEDIELARSLGVKSTPTIFLWGRKVDRQMLMNTGFVEEIKRRYNAVRNQQLANKARQHPESTPGAQLPDSSDDTSAAPKAGADDAASSGTAADAPDGSMQRK